MPEAVAELELETITHTLVGGYDASSYSVKLGLPELPRAQEFKGLWRWWFRALVGGALWETGFSGDDLKSKTREAAKRVLGSLDSASKLVLNVDLDPDEWKKKFVRVGISRERFPLGEVVKTLKGAGPLGKGVPPLPPRLTLLQLGQPEDVARSRISCYEPGARLKLVLRERLGASVSELEERVALEALCLSQIFGGIGKMTRRGFGAVRVSLKSGKYRDIEKAVNRVFSGESAGDLLSALESFVDQSLEDARALLGGGGGGAEQKGLPDFPVISKDKYFKFRVCTLTLEDSRKVDRALRNMGYRDTKTLRLLAWLGYSTMELAWRAKRPGRVPHIWVLGLPRGAGRSRGQDYRRARRASSISLRPLKRLGESSWHVMVYGFLSKDWPENVPTGIEEAFGEAWGMVGEILGCSDGGQPV